MLLRIYGRLSHSWSTCGTRDATHASQERGNKYEIVTTANGIYLWWQIFVSGKQFMITANGIYLWWQIFASGKQFVITANGIYLWWQILASGKQLMITANGIYLWWQIFEAGKQFMITANGIYLWWQIFVSGKQFMMAMVKVMISTLPPETRSFSSFLVSIIISQRNSDRKHKFWNIVSTAERCILHMHVLLECRFICIRKFTME